jgi:hypothetical protein
MEASLQPVVEKADANREFFERWVRSLTSDQLETVVPGGTWRAKDYVAHLATIDIYVGEWFEHVADGRRWHPNNSEDGSPFNIDTWNESRIVERRDATAEDLLAEAAENRANLLAAVDRFTPEILASEFDFRGAMTSYQRYLELWTLHDPAHSFDMLRGLPELKGDPELRAWIDQLRG